MNISLQNVNNVSAVLTVQIEKADYQEKVDKALKTVRQRVNMPGFRKGMVPMSLVKKQFGTSVKVEEIDKLMQEKVSAYIEENKVDMLGAPLPKVNNANFDTDENFEFSFDIALAPQFTVDLSNNDTVDYYDIEVTDEMVEQQVKMYAQRNGQYEKVEDYQDNDMMKGLLAELDENGNTKEGGLQVRRYDAYLHEERRSEGYLQRSQGEHRAGIQSVGGFRQQRGRTGFPAEGEEGRSGCLHG